jgi:hypothetical protein
VPASAGHRRSAGFRKSVKRSAPRPLPQLQLPPTGRYARIWLCLCGGGGRSTLRWWPSQRPQGVNTLRFQIAREVSTAISTFQPTPAVSGPCGSSPGDPAVPQELAGAPGPCWTRPSGHMLGLGRPCFVLGCMHPKCIQHHFQWPQAAPPYLSPPQKNVSLRRPCGAGVRPLKYPEVPRARLRRCGAHSGGSRALSSQIAVHS